MTALVRGIVAAVGGVLFSSVLGIVFVSTHRLHHPTGKVRVTARYVVAVSLGFMGLMVVIMFFQLGDLHRPLTWLTWTSLVSMGAVLYGLRGYLRTHPDVFPRREE